ncbi:NADPH oxidase activator 1 [Hyla sarda]|uniref:NADPH oxidase activator 1 n=1 Tax=Hyla sarda TaxID=327740 RepID=UPI0024C388E7|nr:NADPH oxidase activator 1 [Hyla sarda]XP_056393714.1 NADPH oxidase activator 1 [Hyla sarda]XP_056393716.1 NADPH oxidase activator 1 [Hyla sarda]XP_056393717.1 NADPH oxidase activator 1 [Hyla sarda]XP_056393718.1 NADPH oxidase activator 1 [Hyla sarda]XP_056393719.1 NADPH oxidase activator 1 [Hyla sarda]
MHYKDLVKCWHEGVLAAEKKDLDAALKSFTSIEDPPSKIWFNIGCIHLQREDLLNAQQAYSQSVTKDPCLAVGFFQRSYVHFKLQWYERALGDCHLAMAQLRNNSLIDYKQLGLHHLLHAWEVLYNTAVILCYLGKWESAQQKINEAVKWLPGDIKNAKLEAAQAQILNRSLLQPIQVPDGEIFRPRKQEVELLNSKDFLGKPKVISSVVPNDQYSGFEPLRPQKPGFYQPCPDFMQGQDSGYHRVMVHYYPENSGEVAVKANSILFVLNKHGDWATAIHDGQKILIPTNFLESVDAPKVDMKRINNGIPLPPMKMPPTRPNAKATGNPLSSQHVPPRPMADLPVPSEKSKVEDPAAPPKDDPAVTTSVHDGDEEETAASAPPEQEQSEHEPIHRGPMEMTAPTVVWKEAEPRPLQRVEMVMNLQSCAPGSRDIEKGAAGTDKGTVHELESPPSEEEVITIKVHMEFTVDLSFSKNVTYQELQRLLRNKLKQQGEQMDVQLSYRDMEGKELTSVKDDGDLQGMWKQAKNKRLMLCCKDALHCVGRPILYHMKAVYTYTAEGPEDLPFKQGDIIDIFSEVNEEWLEGHCNGSIGIFPKCFATKVNEQDES